MNLNWDNIANMSMSGAVFLSAALFVIVYHRHAPWRSSSMGWHLMAWASVVGLLGLYTVAINLWPDGDLAIVLRVCRTGLLLAVAVLLTRQTLLVLRSQKANDR